MSSMTPDDGAREIDSEQASDSLATGRWADDQAGPDYVEQWEAQHGPIRASAEERADYEAAAQAEQDDRDADFELLLWETEFDQRLEAQQREATGDTHGHSKWVAGDDATSSDDGEVAE